MLERQSLEREQAVQQAAQRRIRPLTCGGASSTSTGLPLSKPLR
jgi:hypothetical protein